MQTEKTDNATNHFSAINMVRGFYLSGTLINSILEPAWHTIPQSWFFYLIQIIYIHPLDNHIGMADSSLPAFLLFIGATQVFSVKRQRSQNKTNWQILVRLLKRCILFIILTYCFGVGITSFFHNPKYITEYSVELAFALLVTGVSAIYLSWRSWGLLLLITLALHGIMLWEVIKLAPYYSINLNFPDFFLRCSIVNYIFDTPNKYRYLENSAPYYLFYLLRLPRLLSICFLGNLLGLVYLRISKPSLRAPLFFVFGILCMLIGWYLSSIIPIARKSWTPTYTILNSGYAILFLSLAEYLTTVWHKERFVHFLIILGRNPLITWLSFTVLPLSFTSLAILSYLPAHFSGIYLPLYNACIQITICWLVIYSYDRYSRRYRRSSTE